MFGTWKDLRMAFRRRRGSPPNIPNIPTIPTARLRIVPGNRALVAGFVSVCDPTTMEHLGWGPDDVASMCHQVGSGAGRARLVVDRGTGQVVGCVLTGEVGATLTIVGWIGTSHRRQGYGTEVLESLCAHARLSGSISVLLALPTANPELVPFVERRQFVATGSHQLLNHHKARIDTVLYRRLLS